MKIDFTEVSMSASTEKMGPKGQRFFELYGLFMKKYMKHFTFLQIPIMAFFSYLFYGRSRLNYTEHLVANFYIGAQILFFSVISLPLFFVVNFGMAAVIAFSMTVIYTSYAYGRVFSLAGYSKRGAIIRGVLSSSLQYFVYSIVFALIAMAFAAIYLYRTEGFG